VLSLQCINGQIVLRDDTSINSNHNSCNDDNNRKTHIKVDMKASIKCLFKPVLSSVSDAVEAKKRKSIDAIAVFNEDKVRYENTRQNNAITSSIASSFVSSSSSSSASSASASTSAGFFREGNGKHQVAQIGRGIGRCICDHSFASFISLPTRVLQPHLISKPEVMLFNWDKSNALTNIHHLKSKAIQDMFADLKSSVPSDDANIADAAIHFIKSSVSYCSSADINNMNRMNQMNHINNINNINNHSNCGSAFIPLHQAYKVLDFCVKLYYPSAIWP
jgi:hypothetical protein